MALNKEDQKRVRQFLLGKLEGDEQQRLEERLIVEDNLFEEFEISKGELIEEYCADDLTSKERHWFERNFLASPEGKESYAFAMALRHLRRDQLTPPRITFWEKLQRFFKRHPMWIATASTVAVVVIVATIFISRPQGKTFVGPTLASSIINREQGSLPTKVTIPSDAKEIRLSLLLPSDEKNSSYRAELDNQTEVTPAKVVEYNRNTVSVVIPVSQLPRGQYSLKLVAVAPDGKEREIPGDFRFDVQ